MKDKVIGACLGTAIGDALGMPAECKKPETIRRLYGKITGYRTPKSAKDGKPFHHNLSAGMWTDDTQLMLAIGESIVENKRIDYEDMAANHCIFYAEKRGWGTTTKLAVKEMMIGKLWSESGIEGAVGTGPPMKIAPIGVLYGLGYISDFELVGVVHNISSMTHKGSASAAAAFAQAKIIGKVMMGECPSGLLSRAGIFAKDFETVCGGEIQLSPALGRAVHLVETGAEDDVIREEVGCSPYVLEAFPFTYAMLLKYYREPKKCMEIIVNSGGDADTTGAMAGAVLGALYGYKVFPLRWRLLLEDRHRIINMAKGLYELKDV